jgi:hypothetical protein
VVLSLVSPWDGVKSVALSVSRPPLKRSAPVPPVIVSLPALPFRVSLPRPPQSRSLAALPFSTSSPFWPKSRSGPVVPLVVLEPLPSTFTVSLRSAVAMPSETLTVISAVPVLPETAVAVSVLFAAVPPSTTLEFGTRVVFVFETRVRLMASPSGSLRVRLIVPERSLVPHEPTAATPTVGASLSGVTVMLTLAAAGCRRAVDGPVVDLEVEGVSRSSGIVVVVVRIVSYLVAAEAEGKISAGDLGRSLAELAVGGQRGDLVAQGVALDVVASEGDQLINVLIGGNRLGVSGRRVVDEGNRNSHLLLEASFGRSAASSVGSTAVVGVSAVCDRAEDVDAAGEVIGRVKGACRARTTN